MLRNNINEVQKLVEKDGIVFLTFGSFLTQTLISGITEALEQEAKHYALNRGFASNIFTIFIELAQNMKNYSKSSDLTNKSHKTEGIIIIGKESDNIFYIDSQNVVSQKDKDLLEKKLVELKQLDREEIKKRYRKLRRSGKDMHGKGAGIGFYEIAKRCSYLNYEFIELEQGMYDFYFEATIKTTQREQ